METLTDRSEYIERFETFYSSFKGLEKNQHKNFEIKKNHSYRVAELMETIAAKANLSDGVKAMAFVAGLFHDIGRFPQFMKYNTFNDAVSADHAALSVEVLQNEGILSDLQAGVSEAICSAIQHHNKAAVPDDLPEDTLALANLLRDADKLDIYAVLCDYYENPGKEPNHTLTWEMPDGFKISDGVAAALSSKETVPKAEVKNKLDIKVFQMSWVYDLNFNPSFHILSGNRYIDRIYGTMPKSGKVIEYYRGIKIYIENIING
jgi:hypothetical protein